jgi:glucose/arabinose dehydrogenase
MDGEAPKPTKRSHVWERVLEVALAILLIGAVSSWVWWSSRESRKDESSQTTTEQAQTTPVIPKLSLQFVIGGLVQATNVEHAPGGESGRLYITEKRGLIKVHDQGQMESSTFLDISGKVRNLGELGLIGLVFDPNFASNQYFYVYYNRASDKAAVIARYQANADGLTAKSDSESIILIQPKPYDNHNGGQLAFGPDGYLYIAFGDGGSGGDPHGNGQNLGTWLGKMLRVDVNGTRPYAVPADNPFVSTAGAKPEIWALGLRNPWRFSFDKQNGKLIIGDVGQNKFEEINVTDKGEGGLNFGWRCMEGNESYNPTGCQAASAYEPPVLAYGLVEGRCSITGGYAYRGSKVVGFGGRYIYGDYCTGEIWSINYEDPKPEPRLEVRSTMNISTFGQDGDGELYAMEYRDGGGVLYKIVSLNP